MKENTNKSSQPGKNRIWSPVVVSAKEILSQEGTEQDVIQSCQNLFWYDSVLVSFRLLTLLQNYGYDDSRLEQILQSHIVVPNNLQSDDFASFFKARENALLERIEQAMGKPVARVAASEDFDTLGEELETQE